MSPQIRGAVPKMPRGLRARLARGLARFRWGAVGRRGAFMGGRCMLCMRPGLTRREGRVCDACDAEMWSAQPLPPDAKRL